MALGLTGYQLGRTSCEGTAVPALLLENHLLYIRLQREKRTKWIGTILLSFIYPGKSLIESKISFWRQTLLRGAGHNNERVSIPSARFTHPLSSDPSKAPPSVRRASSHGPTHELGCAAVLVCPVYLIKKKMYMVIRTICRITDQNNYMISTLKLCLLNVIGVVLYLCDRASWLGGGNERWRLWHCERSHCC